MARKDYKKLDDQTLLVSQDLSNDISESGMKRFLRQIFNFRARQVTTVWESRYHYSDGGVSSSIQTQGFSEIEGKGALRDAHAKLTEMGGNPDPVEDAEDAGVRKKKHTLKIE